MSNFIPPHEHSLPFFHTHSLDLGVNNGYGTLAKSTFTNHDNLYKITADVPTFTKDNLTITFKMGVLSIKGETNIGKKRVVDLSFEIPEADETQIKGTVENGFLMITIGKKEEFMPKVINL